jgi:hypothetical protein
MKNAFSIIAAIVVITFSASSCSKCTNCTKSGGSVVRLCEKDYDSNTAYGFAIDVQESAGYNCR